MNSSSRLVRWPRAALFCGAIIVHSLAAADRPAPSALEAGIVPGADFLLRIDFASARRAPIYGSMKEAEDQRQSEKQADLPPGLSELSRELEEKLGLKEEDFESLVISADLDKVKSVRGGENPLANSQALLAIRVSRDVKLDQIESALTTLAKTGEEPKTIKTSKLKIAGHETLRIAPDKENDPPFLIAVHEGKTLFMGMNEASLSGAFGRAKSQAASLDPALARVMDSIPAGSQLKLSFVVPRGLRQTLQGLTGGAGAENGEAPAGPGAMLAGFTDIRSLSLSLNLSDKAAVKLSGDMGSPEAAQGLNMMLAMLKPQLMAGLAQKAGKTPQQMPANALVTSLQGQVLSIALLLDQDLLSALNAP